MIDRVPWPTALIFDLDGTLVDSAPDIATAVNSALATHQVNVDTQKVRDFLGDGAARLIERVLDDRGIEVDAATFDAALSAFHVAYEARPCERTVCYDGVKAMLTTARMAGRRLAICTNKPQEIAARVLDHLGIAQHIDVLVGAGRYALKPDPEPLHACIDALGIDRAGAVYIGDMAVDCEAARRAAVPAVLVRFGYSQTDVADFSPDAVLDRWDDWPQVRATLEDKRSA